MLHAVDGVCEREAAPSTAGLLHAVDCFCKVEAGVRVSSSGRGREGEGERGTEGRGSLPGRRCSTGRQCSDWTEGDGGSTGFVAGGGASVSEREQGTLRIWDSGGDVSERMADPPVSGTQLTPGGSSKPPALKSI